MSETGPQAPAPESDEDFENCKGQCGYTPWCRACQEEIKKMIHEAERKKIEERESIFDEAERKEATHVDDQYAENSG